MDSKSTFCLWPIPPFGGDNDEDGVNDQNSGDGVNNTNNQQQQQNSGSNSGDGKSSDDDEDDPYKGLSTKELKRLLKDTEGQKDKSEADKKSLQDKIDAQQRKERTDLENANKDNEAKDATIAQLRSALAKQAITGAIRDDKRFEWHNPDIVAQQFNSGEVTVDDDGKVSGIAKALTRLAKDDSVKFLLAKDNTKENSGNEQQQNNQQQQQGQSGFQPGQGGANGGGSQVDPQASELVKTGYTALNTRIGHGAA